MFGIIGPSYSLEFQVVHYEEHESEEDQSDGNEGDHGGGGEDGGCEIGSEENEGEDVESKGEPGFKEKGEIDDEEQDDSVSVRSQRGQGKRKSKAMRKKNALKNAVKQERKVKQAAARAVRKKPGQTPTSSNKARHLASRKGYLENKHTFRFLLRARPENTLPQEVGHIAELHHHYLKPVQEHIEAHAAFPKLKEVILYWRRWRRVGTCDEQFGETCKMLNTLGIDLTYGHLMAARFRNDIQHEQITVDHQAVFDTLTIELDRLLALDLPEEWGQRIQ